MALDPRAQTATMEHAGSRAEFDEGLRKYMLGVYNLMALGVAFTGVIVLALANMPNVMTAIAVGPMKWVLFAGLLGMGFFSSKIITMKSGAAAQAFYWVYCALWGAMISPMVAYFLQTTAGTMDVARAFFITAGMFAGMSLFGYTTKRDLSGFAKFFMMAAIGLLIAMVANIFIGSSLFSLGISAFAVLIFAGVTAWETQMIKNMYAEHYGQDVISRMAIFGALQLYGSFIVMFIHILNIIGIMRSE